MALTSSVYGRKVRAVNKQALGGVSFKKKTRKQTFSKKGSYVTTDDVANRNRYLKGEKRRQHEAELVRREAWRKEQKKLVQAAVKEAFAKP